MVVETDHPTLGRLRTLGIAAQAVADARSQTGRPAPLLGEHTTEVLGEAGYSEAEVAELRAAGAVR